MKLSKLSDEALVDLVRDEDQELYAELVKRYQAPLLRYAQSLIANNHDLATDVVQEAFIKAFVNLQSFDAKKKFSSWIYRIVHNEAINHIRAEKKFLAFNLTDWLKESLPSRVDVEASFDKQETAQKIRQSLKQLPVKYRSVLSLYYLEEKKYSEIGEILRIPTSTVGVRLQRAKKLLKKYVKKKQTID